VDGNGARAGGGPENGGGSGDGDGAGAGGGAENGGATGDGGEAEGDSGAGDGNGQGGIGDDDGQGAPDIADMALELARRDDAPGALYLPGGAHTDVGSDVDEFVASHLLFLYRAMESGANPVSGSELLPDIIRYSSERILNFGRKKATISYDRLKTHSVFAPSKLSSLGNLNMDAGEIYEENGALSLERIMTQGFSYDIEYYSDEEQPLSRYMLLSSYGGLYDDMLDRHGSARILAYGRRAPAAARGQNEYRLSYLRLSDLIGWSELAALRDRAAVIKERYLGLPEDLPERVRSLSLDLTAGKQTDFEKAEELEKFLYTNYEYSLDVSYLPPGEDFVDSFLFAMSQGYCTHFASAMAVMARCAGLPSRYVEGYTLPREASADGAYLVTNAEAHAWVEIYFEGYGWKKFEPTASFQNYNAESPAAAAGAQAAGGSSYYDYLLDEYNMFMEDDYNRYGGPGPFLPAADDSGPGRGLIAARWALYAMLAAVGAALVFAAIGKIRKRRRSAAFSGEPREAVRSMFAHYFNVLRLMNCSIAYAETLSQFAARAEERFRFRGGGFAECVRIYERLHYSNHEISEADRQAVRDIYPQLLEIYAQRSNRLVFRIMKDLLSLI
jgi:hypothetical protein